MAENSSAPLELFIKFDSLPTWQVGTLMLSLSNLYTLLMDPDFPLVRFDPYQSALTDYQNMNQRLSVDAELCLDFARSGNSITFKFGGHGVPPAFRMNSSTDYEVDVPARWAAAAAGVAVLLAGAQYSQELYSAHLARQATIADIASKKAAQQLAEVEIEKIKAETDKQQTGAPTERAWPQSTVSKSREERKAIVVQNNIDLFNSVIGHANITAVIVNNVHVKVENPTMAQAEPYMQQRPLGN